MRILKWGCGGLTLLFFGLLGLAVVFEHKQPTSMVEPAVELQGKESSPAKTPPEPDKGEDVPQESPLPSDTEHIQSSQYPQEQIIEPSSPSEAATQESDRVESLNDYPDLFVILSRASVGEQDLDALRGSYVQGNEAFQVESVVDGFAIYQLRPDLRSMTQNPHRVALVRDPHKSYITGSLLPRDVYTLRGAAEFISALGVHEMLPVIERGRR